MEIDTQCKIAFPGIEKDNHDFSIKALQELMDNPQQQKQQTDKLQELFQIPESGSAFIDQARTARSCGDYLRQVDERNQIKQTISSAETKLAEAILRGEQEAKIMPAGKGISHLSDAFFTPPELKGKEKEVFEAINKNPNLKAELKASKTDKSDFHIVVSMRQKI